MWRKLTGRGSRPRRTIGSVLVTLALVIPTAIVPVVVSATPAGAAAGEGPAGDAFYSPPSPLPAGKPGDVIWYRRKTDVNNASAYLILYLSRDAQGKPNAVSGTILVPKGRSPVGMPIVGLASGSVGLGDQCAPSKNPLVSVAQNQGFIDQALLRGWAVAMSDYEGLGTPGAHTYVVGRSEGRAVLDAVRAAQRLPATGLSTANPVGLLGYSQGGGAAAWAGELQPTYAPELNLRAISAGGVPADLLAVSSQLDGGIGFAVLAMAAAGLDAAYPELNLDGYLNDAGRIFFGKLATSCIESLVAYPFRRISDYTTTNLLNTPAWIARINEQKLGSVPPTIPTFLYHGWPTDELVALPQAEALKNTYCAAGAPIRWRTYLGEHATTIFTARPTPSDSSPTGSPADPSPAPADPTDDAARGSRVLTAQPRLERGEASWRRGTTAGAAGRAGLAGDVNRHRSAVSDSSHPLDHDCRGRTDIIRSQRSRSTMARAHPTAAQRSTTDDERPRRESDSAPVPLEQAHGRAEPGGPQDGPAALGADL
uniref:lipase family protein n=1 Tax=Parafrankia discariae TaxID=365528 RepID=UPI001E2C068F|nr:lipase family protein [Parafrankia discariae]